MISKKLQEARQYEREYLEAEANKDKENDRPLFHATGTVGWINDPNGFSVYKGDYHLFYQYYPHDTHWGPMHWGHSISKDLVTWEYLPCALAPDEDYDHIGCFSGSAIELEDGRMLLMYTSVVRHNEDGKDKDYQQQAIAIGDGVDFEKVTNNPVITTDMIPAGNNLQDFRDPKVIKHDGKYYSFMINRSADDSGQIFVYESEDCLNWKFNRVLDKSDNQVGKVWECPDYFTLGDRKVLIVSPQEVEGNDMEVYPGYNNFFLVGHGNEFLDFNRESVQQIDYGMDFYAAQTVLTPDGRRVMIAWMQNWETCNYGNDLHDYYGMMTLPRELRMDGGYVIQQPIREIENYYKDTREYKDIALSGSQTMEGLKGRVLDMSLMVRPRDMESDYDFIIKVAKDANYETSIAFDSKKGTITLDRSKSGVRYSSLSTRVFKVKDCTKELKLRVIIDKYALEIFINDGKQAAAMKLDTPIEADGIVLESMDDVIVDVTAHSF